MTTERAARFLFALECAAFELNQTRKMANGEKRHAIADNIQQRIEELDELANLIFHGEIQEIKGVPDGE